MPPTKTAKTPAKPKAKATTARRSTRRRKPTADQVATRAYFIALEQGGDPLDNWLRAEQELAA